MSDQSIPEAQRTAPEKIWLHIVDMSDIDDMPYDPDVAWVNKPIGDNSIPYVRADLIDKGSECHPGDGGLTADLSDEQLKAAADAGWEEAHLCTDGRLNSRSLAAFRSVAELARQGWERANRCSDRMFHRRAAAELAQQGRQPIPDIPLCLSPICYDAGAEITIERTILAWRSDDGTLPPKPERWVVRRRGNCLTTNGNWVHEEQPSERPEDWLALHRFPTLQAAWEALQRAKQSEDQP